ncbi:MAG: glycosyltransferase family 4 protein [Prevotellaceae bacterium]|jgi:glycosyltransferase involved in cell wall biosynthesis|nr:glycosyltransferase family 4 protein [Prevotellaceae bacterium]
MSNKQNIYFATPGRGFLKHFLKNNHIQAEFIWEESQIYGSSSRKHRLISKFVRLKIFSWLGLIQIVKPPKQYDLYGSCNRFLNTDKPYFIYVENPTALYHYCLGRNKTFLGKRKVTNSLNNPNLRALVFWSNICQNTFEVVCGKVPQGVIRKVIYNLVPRNNLVSPEAIKAKSYRKELNLLYCVQGMRFASKGGLEIVNTLAYFNKILVGGGVILTIITNLDVIKPELRTKIKNSGITLLDFKFTPEQMEKIYADTNILLQPTSDDSFGLTILEAMKGGCAVIASRLYAIPEMVKEGENGFLTDPAWWFFNLDGTPNPKVWNHRKKTIYSGKISDRIVSFLIDKILLLNNDRGLLEQMSINSYEKANSAPFDEETITGQWNEVFREMGKI